MRWDDPQLHVVASEFFRTFARMEYALKATGRMTPKKRNAEADWSLFAEQIHEAFSSLESSEVKNAVAFILNEPPRKQINSNGSVRWSATLPDAKSQTDLVLQYVCRIRNNLFHGGKFNGRWFEPGRSGALIEAGLLALHASLEVSPEVREAYRA